MSRAHAIAWLSVCLLSFDRTASGQVFVGGGVGGGTDDKETVLPWASRGPCSGWSGVLEGGVFLNRYVAVGAEYFRCSDIDEEIGARNFHYHPRESESVVTASIRARWPLSQRLSILPLVGVGVMRSDVSLTGADASGVLILRTNYHETNVNMAILFGAEVEVSLIRHLSLVPTLRICRLSRPVPNIPSGSRPAEWNSVVGGVLLRTS
jgi:hypothetical protein